MFFLCVKNSHNSKHLFQRKRIWLVTETFLQTIFFLFLFENWSSFCLKSQKISVMNHKPYKLDISPMEFGSGFFSPNHLPKARVNKRLDWLDMGYQIGKCFLQIRTFFFLSLFRLCLVFNLVLVYCNDSVDDQSRLSFLFFFWEKIIPTKNNIFLILNGLCLTEVCLCTCSICYVRTVFSFQSFQN